jgi:hypothetical protein
LSFIRNTYGSPRKCCKQKTYRKPKSFRCNTYKKHGGGGSSTPTFDSSTFNSSTLRLFHGEPFRRSLLSLFAPRVFHNSFAIKPFHTVLKNAGVIPPWSLYLKYYFNSSANSLLIPFPTFYLPTDFSPPDVPTFKRFDIRGGSFVLPSSLAFSHPMYSICPEQGGDIVAGRESQFAVLGLPVSDHFLRITLHGSRLPLPWPVTTTAPIPPSRHYPASWRGLSSAPTTKSSA